MPSGKYWYLPFHFSGILRLFFYPRNNFNWKFVNIPFRGLLHSLAELEIVSHREWNTAREVTATVDNKRRNPLSRCQEVSQRLSKLGDVTRNVGNNTTCEDIGWITLPKSFRDCLRSLLEAFCSNEFNRGAYKSDCVSILEKISISFSYRCSQDIDRWMFT